jgi:hypothetical protein
MPAPETMVIFGGTVQLIHEPTEKFKLSQVVELGYQPTILEGCERIPYRAEQGI